MPTNAPPSVNGTSQTQTFQFPFQPGSAGFPAMADPDEVIFQSIQALLLTGPGERRMHPSMGVSVDRLVFDNLTPLMKARVAMEVTRAIETYEPRARVMRVDSRLGKRSDGTETAIFVDVLYMAAGQQLSQTVEYPLSGSM